MFKKKDTFWGPVDIILFLMHKGGCGRSDHTLSLQLKIKLF